MHEITEKSKQKGFIIISIMLFSFSVLKVIRGADTSITTEGGIWNYISLLYYIVAIIGVIYNRTFKAKAIFVAPLLYSVFSMIFALGNKSVGTSFNKIYVFLMIPYFFLVFVSFYFFSEPSLKAEKIILLAYIVCLLINAYTIIGFLLFNRSRAMANDVYYSLCLFPFALLFVKNKKWKTIVIVLQFFVTFLSNKRSGFIALCIGLVLYFLLEANNDNRNNFFKMLGRMVMIIVAVYVMYEVSYYLDSSLGLGIYDRLNRLETDDGSGRGRMYVAVWQGIRNSNWFDVLFGHGMNSAGRVAGAGYAHNDFLEVLYDYGVVSFVCIVVYFVSLIRYAIQMIIRKSPYAPAFAFSMVIGITLSMFSYFLIFYTFVTCIMAFWGYVLKMETSRISEVTDFDCKQERLEEDML